MSKPAIWTSVYVGNIDIRYSTVKTMVIDSIYDVLSDNDMDKDCDLDLLEREVTRIANCILSLKYYVEVRNDIEDFVERLVEKAIKKGEYSEIGNSSGDTFDCNGWSEADVKNLKKILRTEVMELFNPKAVERVVKQVKKPKEDPCITELKALAKKLGYTLCKS